MNSFEKRVSQLRRTEKERITETDVYMSPEFNRHLLALGNSVLEGTGECIRSVGLDFDGSYTACTQGSVIKLNVGTDLVQWYEDSVSRYRSVMGMFLHEVAHCRYTDFDTAGLADRYIASGRMFGETPVPASAEDRKNLEELVRALADPVCAPLFTQMYGTILNIFEDVYIEESLTDEFGKAVSSIRFPANAMKAQAEPLEDIEDGAANGRYDDFCAAASVLLHYARFGEVCARFEDTVLNSRYTGFIRECGRHIQIGCHTPDMERKYTEANYLMLSLWPFVRNVLNASPSGSCSEQPESAGTGSSSGTGTPSPEAVQNALESLDKAMENSGLAGSSMPSDRESSSVAKAAKAKGSPAEAGSGRQTPSPLPAPPGTDGGIEESIMEQVLNEIAGNRAETAAEKECGRQLEAKVQEIRAGLDAASPHTGIPLNMMKYRSVTENMRQQYEVTMKDIAGYSRNLQRKFRNLSSELCEPGVTKHRLYGSKLVTDDLYRTDRRCFSKKKLPVDPLSMAVCVLVDLSGSMDWEGKIENARKAALLLYDFANGTGIPIHIAGHNATGKTVNYEVFADFEGNPKADRYRIAGMYSRGCNRDGMALEIASKLLMSRTETVKLLLIISDGKPNHSDYGGDEAAEDIRKVCAKARKAGVDVIACGIGSDRADIEEIYRDSFLDISDLTSLPKTMLGIVRRKAVGRIA